MEIIKATLDDANDILTVLSQGAKFLHECGVDQWTGGYPAAEDVEADIQRECCYILINEGKPAAAFSAIIGEEPTYVKIYKGKWLSEGNNYCTVHRMAVSDACRGKGVASLIYAFVEKLCRDNGVVSMRVDTHEHNKAMRSAIEKSGFTYCGFIYLEDGSPRVAYEKMI